MKTSTDDLIECKDQRGNLMRIPAADFLRRPGAYGIIDRDGKLLLSRLRTGKYFLPGGGLDSGETEEEALRREVREEVGGLHVEVGEPLGVFDHFYFYNPTQSAWHAVCHVYLCDIADHDDIPAGAGSEEEGYPEWVPLEKLTDDVLHPGIMKRVMDAYRDFLLRNQDE